MIKLYIFHESSAFMSSEASEGNGQNFAMLLRAKRRDAGLTQNELARASQMSVAAIRDLEQGRRRAPRSASLTRLANALQLNTVQIHEFTRAAREPCSPARYIRSSKKDVASLRFSVLGPLTAWLDGMQLHLGPPRQRAVLGLLAASPGTLIPRDALIGALWGENVPASAVNLIQAYVARLRRILEPDRSQRDRGGRMASVGSGYRLQASVEELDVLAFRELTSRADGVFSAGDAAAACELYGEAVAMYRGDPLADIDLLKGTPAVAKLAAERTLAFTRYAQAACAAGWHERTLPDLKALSLSEPLNERVHALLMIALAGSGQQGVALQVYEEIRRRLDDQLGVYPSSELSEAYDRVLRQDVTSKRRVGVAQP
jgi:DNA-binding SARP family transcriptional activator